LRRSTSSATSSRSSCRVNPRRADIIGSRSIALVHDYLNQRGGAERVLRHLADLYPSAPLYTSLYDERVAGDLVAPERVRTSFLQRLPGSSRYFRYLAPFYPAAFERFDLDAYDTIVSTTTAWAKGVRFRPDAIHVCYIHTVSRFAFAYDQYVGGFGLGNIAKPIVARLTEWDRRAAMRPTAFIANSHNVAARVRKYYGREAYVAHCPVDVDRFVVGGGGGGYALVVSRLLPYKRIELAIAACDLVGLPLRIVGSGPARAQLEVAARGTRTSFLGAVSDAVLRHVMADARVVLLPGEEDYGLVPLEANAAGRPIVAYGAGGALETIRPGITGEHFAEPTAASLAAVLRDLDPGRYDPSVLRDHAERFGPEPFKRRFAALVERIGNSSRPEPVRELLEHR
jgi:glycosyltransferase involved in cell wall biosynthesis